MDKFAELKELFLKASHPNSETFAKDGYKLELLEHGFLDLLDELSRREQEKDGGLGFGKGPFSDSVPLSGSKFVKGQRVHICEKMPETMCLFPANQDAIVIGSYTDIYGGRPAREESERYALDLIPNSDGSGGRDIMHGIKKINFPSVFPMVF